MRESPSMQLRISTFEDIIDAEHIIKMNTYFSDMSKPSDVWVYITSDNKELVLTHLEEETGTWIPINDITGDQLINARQLFSRIRDPVVVSGYFPPDKRFLEISDLRPPVLRRQQAGSYVSPDLWQEGSNYLRYVTRNLIIMSPEGGMR